MNNKEIAKILADMNEKEFAQSFPIFHELLALKTKRNKNKKKWLNPSATGDSNAIQT